MNYHVKRSGSIIYTQSSLYFCSWGGLTDHNFGENVLFNAEELNWPSFLNGYKVLSCDTDLEPDYASHTMGMSDIVRISTFEPPTTKAVERG